MPIRLRVALVFVIALAIALILGGWLFLNRLSAAMTNSTDSALAARLSQADRYLRADGMPPSAVVDGSPVPGEFVVQIIDQSRQVRGASADAGTRPLLSPGQLRQARHGEIALTRSIDEESERLLAAPFADRHGWVALAGVSLQPSKDTLRQVTDELLVGGGLFLIIAGIGAYWLARAALAPVERLRREVAAMSEDDTGPTVRVPGTHDEVASLAGTMNDLLIRLRRALARQRAFVADASHELRTPFAVLTGELELAGRPGRSREELAAAVASAGQEAARLTRITDDLLLLARGDEDKLVLHLEHTEIGPLLVRSAQLAHARAETAGVTCRVDSGIGLAATVDAGRIRQAVDNLVDNALRFAPPGTSVVISAEEAGPSVAIEVRDAGPGFPPDFLPHAFERFRRPDQGRARSEGGAGLGLAIVRAIALTHGGRVTASNLPGGGAVVRLEVPSQPGAVPPAAGT